MTTLIPPEQLAREFGLGDDGRRKIIDWARRYGWPHVKVGRTIAFTPADVEQILASHHVDGSREHDSGRLPGQTAMSAARAS